MVVVTDGVTTRQFAFTMEEESPPVPGLRLPATVSQVKAEAYFDWAKVTDASLPVSYHFQVAMDTSFAAPVLDKKELADSEYALAGAEKLPATSPDAPYYWRVKAADSAANESAWSATWSFYVPAPPAPGRLHQPLRPQPRRRARRQPPCRRRRRHPRCRPRRRPPRR